MGMHTEKQQHTPRYLTSAHGLYRLAAELCLQLMHRLQQHQTKDPRDGLTTQHVKSPSGVPVRPLLVIRTITTV